MPELPEQAGTESRRRRHARRLSRERLRDIGDGRIELSGLATESAVVDRELAPSPGQCVRYVTLAMIAAALGALAVWLASSARSPSEQDGLVTRTAISLPEGQRQPRVASAPLAISPDGTLLAYVARDDTGSHLFLRPLDGFEPRKIPGTE